MKTINDFINEKKSNNNNYWNPYNDYFPEVLDMAKDVVNKLGKYSKSKEVEDDSDITELEWVIQEFLWEFVNEFEKKYKYKWRVGDFMYEIGNTIEGGE